MPLTISAETLKRSFGLCHPFVPKRTTNENLKYIRLAIRADCLEMIASDGESSIAHKIIGLPFSDKTGDLILPADRFGQILHESTCEEFRLGGSDGELTVTADGGEYKLQTISPQDYPATAVPIGEPDVSITVAAQALRTAFDLTVLATDAESTRWVLGALRMESVGSTLTIIATDSRRLSIAKVNSSIPGNFTFQLPGRDAKRLISVLSSLADSADVVIAKHGSQITFALGNSLIVSREIAGQFPAWQKVIPQHRSSPTAIVAGPFASVVRQAKLGRDEGETAVRFRFKPGNLICFSGPEKQLGSKIELPISYDGADIKISFNPEYLVAWLGKLDSSAIVEWHMQDAESPVLLAHGDSQYVLMPLSDEESK